jgi:hypothetical protein
MPLTPEQQQELNDLKRMDELETQLGKGKPTQVPYPQRAEQEMERFKAQTGQPSSYQLNPSEQTDTETMQRMQEGMLGQSAGEPAAKFLLSPLAKFIKGKAGRFAVGALNARPEEAAALNRQGAGQTLLETGIMKTPFSSTSGKFERLKEAAQTLGEKKGSIIDRAEQDQVRIDLKKVAEQAKSKLGRTVTESQGAAKAPVLQEIESTLSNAPGGQPLLESGTYAGPRQVDKIKQILQAKGEEATPTLFKPGNTEQAGMYRSAAQPYKEALESQVPGLAQVNKPLSDIYASSKALEEPTSNLGMMLRSPGKGILKTAIGAGQEGTAVKLQDLADYLTGQLGGGALSATGRGMLKPKRSNEDMGGQ